MTQLTDVAPKKARAAPDRQPEVPARRRREADRLRREAERARRRRPKKKEKKDKLPAFELQDRQTAVDLMLSPDDTHVFVLVAERAAGAKNTIVPNYVTETRLHRGHSRAARTSATRRIAACSASSTCKTGKTVWADGSFAPPVPADNEEKPPAPAAGRQAASSAITRRRNATSAGRCPPCPTTASWWWRGALGRQQGSLARRRSIPETGKTRSSTCCTTTRGCGKRAAGSAAPAVAVPARQQAHLVPLRARRLDAPLHARCRRRRREADAADRRASGKSRRRSCRATARSSTSRRPRCTRASGTSIRCPLDGGARTKITSMAGSNQAEVSPDDVDARAASSPTATSRPKCS